MSSGSESGALRSQELPLGHMATFQCPAGPETESPAHSEDRAGAEAREPRALTDCLPGHSPDRASCKTVSTNPEQSPRATWSLALRRHSRPVIPPLLLPFLQSSWSSNSLQTLLLPTQPTVVIIRVTAHPRLGYMVISCSREVNRLSLSNQEAMDLGETPQHSVSDKPSSGQLGEEGTEDSPFWKPT